MAGQITLLGTWRSPYSRRVEMALKLKGVEYEFNDEDLSNKSDLLLQSNPVYKKIPVLLHSGESICESMIIVEYIDEIFDGHKLLSKDPCERAHARFVSKFIDEKCIPGVWQVIKSKGDDREKAKVEICQHLQVLEKELEGKTFFGGEDIGLVDIAANFFSFWVPIFQEIIQDHFLNPKEFPLLCKWSEAFVTHHIIKTALPEKERVFATAKAHFG